MHLNCCHGNMTNSPTSTHVDTTLHREKEELVKVEQTSPQNRLTGFSSSQMGTAATGTQEADTLPTMFCHRGRIPNRKMPTANQPGTDLRTVQVSSAFLKPRCPRFNWSTCFQVRGFIHLTRVSPPQHCWHVGAREFECGTCPVHCRMFMAASLTSPY